LELESIGYDVEALEILARSGNGSLRDTLTLLDQAIIYSKGHVDVSTVTDMLGLVDPKFLEELFGAIFAKDRAKILEFSKQLEEYEAEMVTDELIAYLKERLYDGDGAFSPLVIERFFRILSESKYLFSINADGGFVLNLIFFKMIEALKIKEIDVLIEQFEQNLPDVTLQTPATVSYEAKPHTPDLQETVKEQEKPTQESVAETSGAQVASEKKPQEDFGKKLFEELVAKIADRSYELGECFKNFIEYESFEDGVLSWESCTDEECKAKLRHGYAVIKMLVKETFGFETKIKGLPCSKELRTQQEEPPIRSEEPKEEPNNQQSATMIEEAEGIGASSCVASCAGLDEPRQEVDDIMSEPMVQKAVELFEAKRVVVQSKV